MVLNGLASQLYLDGVPVGAQFNHWPLNQNGNLCIGYNDYNSQEWNGTIDDVAIYSRALTLAEIAGNYEAGTAASGEWTPAAIPGLVAWFDPAQDLFTDGETITQYWEHSTGKSFVPTAGGEPVFRTAPPRLEFPSTAQGLTCVEQINLGLDGLTFVMVNQYADFSNYPMMLVSGPDADGFEMRHSGSTMEMVQRYITHSIANGHGTPDTPGVNNLHVMRVQSGVRCHAWVNAALWQGAGAAAHNQALALYLGRRELGYPYRGTVAEALVFAGPVSDADLALLVDYLKIKHSL
jgi:hypothetical protein